MHLETLDGFKGFFEHDRRTLLQFLEAANNWEPTNVDAQDRKSFQLCLQTIIEEIDKAVEADRLQSISYWVAFYVLAYNLEKNDLEKMVVNCSCMWQHYEVDETVTMKMASFLESAVTKKFIGNLKPVKRTLKVIWDQHTLNSQSDQTIEARSSKLVPASFKRWLLLSELFLGNKESLPIKLKKSLNFWPSQSKSSPIPPDARSVPTPPELDDNYVPSPEEEKNVSEKREPPKLTKNKQSARKPLEYEVGETSSKKEKAQLRRWNGQGGPSTQMVRSGSSINFGKLVSDVIGLLDNENVLKELHTLGLIEDQLQPFAFSRHGTGKSVLCRQGDDCWQITSRSLMILCLICSSQITTKSLDLVSAKNSVKDLYRKNFNAVEVKTFSSHIDQLKIDLQMFSPTYIGCLKLEMKRYCIFSINDNIWKITERCLNLLLKNSVELEDDLEMKLNDLAERTTKEENRFLIYAERKEIVDRKVREQKEVGKQEDEKQEDGKQEDGEQEEEGEQKEDGEQDIQMEDTKDDSKESSRRKSERKGKNRDFLEPKPTRIHKRRIKKPNK